MRPEEPFEFSISAEKSVSISIKIFFLNYIFEDHLILGEKAFEFPITAEKSEKDLFFL